MLKGKNGFTLIELIVVLIIVGILAAVAAPMYQSFSEKARASEAVSVLGSIRSAEQAYYLANGYFLLHVGGFGGVAWSELGFSDPNSDKWNYWTDIGWGTGTATYRDHDGSEASAAVDLVIHAQRLETSSQYYLTQICLGHTTDGRWIWCWTNTVEGPNPGIPNN